MNNKECMYELRDCLNKQLYEYERTKQFITIAKQFQHLNISWAIYWRRYQLKHNNPMEIVFKLYILSLEQQIKKQYATT